MGAEPSSLEKAFTAEAPEDAVLGFAQSAEQLDLLRGDDGKLPQNVFRIVRQEGDRQRGKGRPPGARNKRNDDLAKLIVHQHGDPVMAMASLYSRPLDQLIELVLIADSTAEREERLLALCESAEGMINAMVRKLADGGFVDPSLLNAATHALERVFDAAKALKMKPGDLAIKALNLQLAAAKAVAEYVHSKKPVEANVSVAVDGVMVMAAAPAGSTFDQQDAIVRQAADGIAEMLRDGQIDPARLADFRFVDGQFVEAEFTEVPEGDDV
jgi:hypothetical protein